VHPSTSCHTQMLLEQYCHQSSPHKLLNRMLWAPPLLLLLLHLLLPRCPMAACPAPAAPHTPAAFVAAGPAAAAAAAGLWLWWGRHRPCGNIQLLALLAKVSLHAVTVCVTNETAGVLGEGACQALLSLGAGRSSTRCEEKALNPDLTLALTSRVSSPLP
jgi:hypothetical protein